jgi:predicted nucleic acid-binding protein
VTRRVVVDANAVYSALLKDGSSRRALMSTGAVLFAPRFLRIEIEKHKVEIQQRSGAKDEDVEAALAVIYRRIAWVADADLEPHLSVAHEALGKVDDKDVPYLACALAVDADAIWSRDPHFGKQDLVPAIPHPDAVGHLKEGRPCDARCRGAKSDTSKCVCECGGANHGVSYRARVLR